MGELPKATTTTTSTTTTTTTKVNSKSVLVCVYTKSEQMH
jgi:hypothetical protein